MAITLAHGFRVAGYNTELVVFNHTGELKDSLPPELPMRSLNRQRAREALGSLVRYFRETKPVIVLTTLHHTAIIVSLAVRISRVPIKLIIREANHLGKLTQAQRGPTVALRRSLLRQAYRHADLLVAVSNELETELKSFVNTPKARIVTRYNPIIDQQFFKLAESVPTHRWLRSDAAAKHPIVMAAGRLVEQKDFPTLIRAVKLLQRYVPARLIIFGAGPRRQELEQLIHELDMSHNIDLPGFEDNLPAALARASVFALSSRWEGLPGVLIQAMALGVPVVATDCPTGPREILSNSEWGRLVPVGDAEQMAAALRQALVGIIAPPPPEATSRFFKDTALAYYLADLDNLAHEQS